MKKKKREKRSKGKRGRDGARSYKNKGVSFNNMKEVKLDNLKKKLSRG